MKKLCYKCLHYGEPTVKSERSKQSTCYAPTFTTKTRCSKCGFTWFWNEVGEVVGVHCVIHDSIN